MATSCISGSTSDVRAAGRGAARPAPSHLAGEALAVFAAYALFATWWLWPLPVVWSDHAVDVGSRMRLTGADFDLIAWVLAWSSHVALHPDLSLFDAPIFHPARGALAFSEHAFGYLPLFAPVYWWTHNAVFAANVTLFATFPLCGTAMYALARRFVSRPGALLAGFVYAFCSIRYETLWHLHLLGTFWMPLALLATERLLERARARDAALLMLALTLQCLSSYYLAYALALLYGPYAAVAVWQRRSELDRRRLWAWGLACLAAGVVLVVVSEPYFRLRAEGLLPDYRQGTWRFANVWPAEARQRVAAYLTWPKLGAAVLAFATTGALFPPRKNRGAYARWVGLVAVGTGLVFAAGPAPRMAGHLVPTPYGVLTDLLPGFHSIRAPWRFLVVSQLGMALLAGLGLDRLTALAPVGGRRMVVSAALAVVVLAAPRNPPLLAHAKPDLESPPPALLHLAATDRRAPLLELPVVAGARAATRMLRATAHWLPTLGGYSAYPPPLLPFFERVAAELPAEPALQRLVDLVDVEWILVHLDEMGPRARALWLGALPGGLVVEGRWGSDLLLRVDRAPATDARSRLLSRHWTPGGVSLDGLGARCPGRIVPAVPAVATLAPGSRLTVPILLTNEDERPWPGFGVFGDGLVRVDATLRSARNGRAIGDTQAVFLDADPRPGEAARGNAELTMPRRAGSYRIELAAFQGPRALEECGIAPVLLEITVAERPSGSDPVLPKGGAAPSAPTRRSRPRQGPATLRARTGGV